MDIVIKKLILFLIMFTVVYIGYYFLTIRPYNKKDDGTKKRKKKKNNEERVEIQYLINKYKVDIKNINMNNLLWDIAFVNSFIISLTVVVIGLDVIKGYIWKILLGFVVLIPSILLGYKILGIKYNKQKEKRK